MQNDKRDFHSLLQGIGLSLAEAKTYVALLESGSVSIRKLAAMTDINRGTTYESLKRLVNSGLVSVRQQGERERYEAESPEKVYALIREKRRELTELDTAAKSIVPGLIARKRILGGQPIVRYYQDDEGIVTILKDVLQTCSTLPEKEYCAYSSSPIRRYLYRRFPLFTVRRIAEGIHVRVIAVGEGGEITEKSERKWLKDATLVGASSYIIIYGNKVATISITESDTPYGVIIEDAGAASMQRLLFNRLWNFLDTNEPK